MAASNPLWKFLFIFCQLWVSFFAERITDKDFRFGNEKQKIVIYRLLGNDMPPGEDPMQQIWNTNFTLRYEPNFHGVQKRWILNRIWNETTFDLIYTLLVQNGVHRRDIISRCFDKAAYSKQGKQASMFYWHLCKHMCPGIRIVWRQNDLPHFTK